MAERITEEQLAQQQAMQQGGPAAQDPSMQQQPDPSMVQHRGASPEDMRNAMAGEGEANANPDQARMQEIHERFVLNVIRLASKDEYDKVMAFMNSADDPVQGFGRALFFILQAVKEGLENKGMEIPGQLWLAENGIIEQSAKAIALLGINAGVQLDKNAVTVGIELASEALAETDDVRKQQKEMQPEDMPQQQPDPGMQPNPGMQQAPQRPQGGLLSQA